MRHLFYSENLNRYVTIPEDDKKMELKEALTMMLEEMPNICQSQEHDLKMEVGDYRVFLSRTTGNPSIEKLVDNRWATIYDPDM